jgi:ceramide glucosyltransferase
LTPLLAAMLAAEALRWDITAIAGVLLVLWFGAEAWLTAAVGWHLTWRAPFLWLLRELALPVLWTQAWLGNGLSWRGREISVARGEDELSARLGQP